MRNHSIHQEKVQTEGVETSGNFTAREDDLIRVWTKMGASTGSLIGRLIGVSAAIGLESIRAINEPLSQNLRSMKKRIDPE